MNLADYIKNKLPYWPNWINYILLKINVFGDKVYGGKYPQIVDKINNLDPDKELVDIVNFAIENVPYYRNKYGKMRINNRQEFEEKIGFIDKDEVMSHWDEFVVDNIDWSKVNIGTTGGTSGKPLKLITPKNRYIREMAFINILREPSGWKAGKTRGMIRNHHLPENRDYIINPITKDIIFDPFRMNDEYANKVLTILRKFDVKFIHAYPSAAYQFLKLCYKQKLDTSFLEACILSSEAVTDDQIYFITKTLGIKISISYGHSEKLIMGTNDCISTNIHIDPRYGLCEIINKDGHKVKEIGTIGEMVGTTLFNKYFPLIRYRTGDFAEFGGYKDSFIGKKILVLQNIYGRRDKSIIIKSDGSYTSITALNLHGTIYEHIDGIQYIQEIKG